MLSPNHTTTSPAPDSQQDGLRRELGVLDCTAIVVGSIIGSGIFLVPHAIAQQLDSLPLVLLVWTAGGVLSLFGAISLAELGAAFPRAGGLYVYLREAYGRPAGFLYGWGLLSMIHSGTIATLSAAFSIYLATFIPLGDVQQKVVRVGCIALLTIVSCIGVRSSKIVQNLFTVTKLSGLGLLVSLLFLNARADRGELPASEAAVNLSPVAAFGLALVAVLWAYEGWHVVSFTAGEIRNPAQHLPKSMAFGTLIIMGVYLITNLGYYSVMTRAEILSSDAVAATAVAITFGADATKLVSALVLLSIFGAMNGFVLTGPRVYYAMARDGAFFKSLARISPRFHTPATAIIVQGAWASLLASVGTFQQLFTYVVFTAWIFYGAAVAAVIVLRSSRPEMERPYRVPGYPWIPAMFCLAALAISLNTILAEPVQSGIGIGLVLVGAVLYPWFRRSGRTSELDDGA